MELDIHPKSPQFLRLADYMIPYQAASRPFVPQLLQYPLKIRVYYRERTRINRFLK